MIYELLAQTIRAFLPEFKYFPPPQEVSKYIDAFHDFNACAAISKP